MSPSVANRGALSALERQVVDAVSIDEPRALLEEFAGLVRVSGTDDEAAAAEYITGRLDVLGVDYQRHDPELYISQPHSGTVDTLDRSYEFGPTKTVSFSASTTVSGPVEYVGSAGPGLLDEDDSDGATEPYADVGDLTNTIALTDAGSLSIRATRILEQRNALGVIAVHEHEQEPHNGIATPIWGGAPRIDEPYDIPEVPIVNVNRVDGAQLREWAAADQGLEVELSTDLTTDWMACPLVVARIEGTPATDEFVLLHGHYDSWHVGITDNATGNAGLLELARVFDANADELERNLRIAWWPGHSTGRYAGSTWYADEFAHELEKDCVAHVNMDSPGAKGATEYADMACWTPEAHPVVSGAIEDIAGAPYEERFPFRAGDYSFDNLGVTGLFMLSSNIPAEVRAARGYHTVGGCGGNSDAWHLTTDTLETAGEEELLQDVRVYAVSLLRVLNAEVLPFDHIRHVVRILETVRRYDEAAGSAFDFSPTVKALETLHADLETFRSAVSAGNVAPEVANETITRLSRVLTRLHLVRRGPFEQDPAIAREPVPRFAPARRFEQLEGDERRFLRLQLKREQNAAVSELRRARALLPDV